MILKVPREEFVKAMKTIRKNANKPLQGEQAIMMFDKSKSSLGIQFGNCGWEIAVEGEWPEKVLVNRANLEVFARTADPQDPLNFEINGNTARLGKTCVMHCILPETIEETAAIQAPSDLLRISNEDAIKCGVKDLRDKAISNLSLGTFNIMLLLQCLLDN